MVIAEVHLAHPAIPLSPTLESVPSLVVHREFQPVSDEGTSWLFFSAERGPVDELAAALDADPTVTAPRLVADVGERRVYRTELTDAAKVVTPTLARLGIKILEVQGSGDGWLLRLQCPGRESLVAFRAYCEAEGIECQVRTLYRPADESHRGRYGLTDAQRDALVTAHERGYFNDPRDVTLQTLAEEMGISSAALGRRIRRGMDRLVAETLRSP